MTRNHSRNAYSAFAEDHRELGAPKRPFSPTLRLKAIAVAVALGLTFWGAIIYLIVA